MPEEESQSLSQSGSQPVCVVDTFATQFESSSPHFPEQLERALIAHEEQHFEGWILRLYTAIVKAGKLTTNGQMQVRSDPAICFRNIQTGDNLLHIVCQYGQPKQIKRLFEIFSFCVQNDLKDKSKNGKTLLESALEDKNNKQQTPLDILFKRTDVVPATMRQEIEKFFLAKGRRNPSRQCRLHSLFGRLAGKRKREASRLLQKPHHSVKRARGPERRQVR
jgi:hypothetical protein